MWKQMWNKPDVKYKCSVSLSISLSVYIYMNESITSNCKLVIGKVKYLLQNIVNSLKWS